MDTLITIAASAGLVAATTIGSLIAGYGLQTLVRLLRHWDTTTPPPALRSGRIAGLEVHLGDADGSTQTATRNVAAGLRRLEETIF